MEFPASDPTVKHLLAAAFGNVTTRRTVKVKQASTYHVSDYWSEGSRNESVFVELATMRTISATSLPSEARQQANNPFNLAIGSVEMVPGIAVVEHVIFRGKDLGYRIYLHASNIAPMLTAPKPAIDPRDSRILTAFRSLKSGPYRQEALRALGYTNADRDRLAAAGFLKVSSNGATGITAEGRIAIS